MRPVVLHKALPFGTWSSVKQATTKFSTVYMGGLVECV